MESGIERRGAQDFVGWVKDVGCAVALLGLGGCTLAEEVRVPGESPRVSPEGAQVVLADAPLAGGSMASAAAPTYLYLRCNSVGWDVSERNRLVPTDQPHVVGMTVEVSAPASQEIVDDCILTETPRAGAWGEWQRYFGIFGEQIQAPSSARLTAAGPRSPQYFRVRYPRPGRYRVQVNRQEGYVSVVADLSSRLGSDAAGEVLWAAPGRLLIAGADAMYRVTDGSGAGISRIEGPSGRSRWHRDLGADVALPEDCVSSQGVVLRSDNQILALDGATGGTKWAVDLDGASGGASLYPMPYCLRHGNHVFVTHGPGHPLLSGLDRSSGALAWTYQSARGLTMISVQPDVLLVRNDDAGRIVGLDPATGRERWSVGSVSEQVWVPSGAMTGVYLGSGPALRRLDPTTGAELWRLQGDDGSPWVTFEQGQLFLHGSRFVARVDATRGLFAWVHRYPAPFGTVLALDKEKASDGSPGGESLLVVRSALEDGTVMFQAVDARSGTVVWSKAGQGADVWPHQDKAGHLYLLGRRSVHRLDRRSGNVVWTYEEAGDSPKVLAHRLSDIVDADARGVYVSYYDNDLAKYPPMGLLALRSDTGALKWRVEEASGVTIAGSDGERLYGTVGYFAPSSKVYLK